MNTLDFAHFYSEKGWQIFPCKPHDKTPLVKWADEATTDLFVISDWWNKYPEANIGLATGKRSGLFALDVDAGHNGEITLAHHIAQFGNFPETPASKTGGGGHHYIFQMPDRDIRNSAGKLGEGLDIRANGGYIVVPPSLHPSGNFYQWEKEHAPSKTKLAPAPDWLLTFLIVDGQESPIVTTVRDGAYISGQRNNALTSLAGTMRRRNMSEAAILQSLAVENLNRCIPPLPDAEVIAIVASVMRYPAQVAPAMGSRDRATAEWSFAKSIYESPESYLDYLSITNDMFADPKIAEYWSDVISGMGVGQAAANAEILTDLEKYQDYLIPRLDDYAANIKHYARMNKISSFAYRLQKAAEDGDNLKIDRAVNELNSIPPVTGHIIESVTDVAEEVERQINARAANPVEVWGIPYRWKRISKHTGGKQKGELTLLAGEPKIGKSFWKLEDILFTAIHENPCFYWCGEMPKHQLMRRFYTLLGVNARNMKSGYMTADDWDKLNDAKALILNSPLYIDDKRLMLHEIRPMLSRMKSEYGIVEFVIDYASKIFAPGKDEIEQTSNVSRELKQICIDLELAGTMIASVNKQGMDNKSALSKSNVRGSGQQIHDADIIYQITTFNEKYGIDYGLMPDDYSTCINLNISAGREFESILEGGFIPYKRAVNSTSFIELEKKQYNPA